MSASTPVTGQNAADVVLHDREGRVVERGHGLVEVHTPRAGAIGAPGAVGAVERVELTRSRRSHHGRRRLRQMVEHPYARADRARRGASGIAHRRRGARSERSDDERSGDEFVGVREIRDRTWELLAAVLAQRRRDLPAATPSYGTCARSCSRDSLEAESPGGGGRVSSPCGSGRPALDRYCQHASPRAAR